MHAPALPGKPISHESSYHAIAVAGAPVSVHSPKLSLTFREYADDDEGTDSIEPTDDEDDQDELNLLKKTLVHTKAFPTPALLANDGFSRLQHLLCFGYNKHFAYLSSARFILLRVIRI